MKSDLAHDMRPRAPSDIVDRSLRSLGPVVRTYVVGEDEGAERPRLDAFVAAHDAVLTRAQVQRLIEAGDIAVNGSPPAKAGVKLRAGDAIAVTIRPPVAVELV